MGPLQDNRADHVSAIAILHRRTAVQDWSEENVRRLGPLKALRVALRADSEGTVPEGETLYVTVLPTLSETADSDLNLRSRQIAAARGPCYERRLLSPVRISLMRISGCSKAAKCPPLSASP